MAPSRKNRSATVVEPALDIAPVPMDEVPETAPVDVSRKPRSRKVAELAAVLPPEAEKENVVNAVPPAKRGGKAAKARAAAEAAQPDEVMAPVTEASSEVVKPAKRVTKKKVLQECNPVTEVEVEAVAKNLQGIQLGRAQLPKARQQKSKAEAMKADASQEAAATRAELEEPEGNQEVQKKKDEKPRKVQKVEKDETKPKRKVKDPEKPKRGSSAYNVFVAHRRAALVAETEPKPTFAEIAKLLGDEWKAMTDEEKIPFEKIAGDDKLRYAAEKEAYLKKKADEGASMDSDEDGDETESAHNSKKSPKGEVSIKRKVKVQLKDPNKPKKAPSGYDVFRKEMQQQVKEQHPEASFGEMSGILGKLWKEVDEAGKREYQLKALPAQEKYKEDISQYRAKQM